MDMTVKFLRKMFKVEEDALGAKGFYPFRFGFYDFLKESGYEYYRGQLLKFDN